MTLIHVFLLPLVLGLCACVGPDKYNPRDHLLKSEDFKTPISAYNETEAKKDLNVLLQFFKKGYVGSVYISPQLVAKTEADLNKLPAPGTANWKQLCRDIAIAFNQLPDGHLMALQRENCLPSELSSRRESNIGKNIAENQTYKMLFKEKGDQAVGVLGIQKFPAADDKRWDGYVDAIKQLKQAAIIIIDLRQNSGGDDSRGIQLASFLKGEAAGRGIVTHLDRTNPETYILVLNKMKSLERRSSPGAWDRYRKFYEDKLSGAIGTSAEFEEKVIEKPKVPPFTGRIYVLVDARCGSSGESTMQALRTLPNVKIVGQNTAGVTHFGNQGMLLLPNSRIEILMSTTYMKFNDGSFIEKVGHKPDIYVPDGIDALDFVLNKIL